MFIMRRIDPETSDFPTAKGALGRRASGLGAGGLDSSMTSRILFLLAALLFAAPAAAQSLSHERFTLPNGLTVILHPDRTLPVAGVNLWYRVGARNEPKGRSGFAHLFEHLMFMGTRRVPGSDFDNLMEAGGGSNNASTSLDRTNYFSSGPSSILPLLLWLDADRLEDLGVNMTREKLDLQRDVVRNELRQNVENAPYGRAYEATYQLLYPENHPYHNGVIGTHQDLEAAAVDDVKNFFATFYAPDNCALVVAGDFDPAQIKPLIERLFGSIPRGGVAPQRVTPPAELSEVKRASMLDKVQLPKLAIAYHSPGVHAPGDAELTLTGALLSEGKNSRLYRRLVERDQTAVSVTASQDGAALGSVFRIDVLAKPDADLAAIEQVVDEEVARFLKEGPTSEELAQRAATIEAALLSSLQGVMARADKLNEYLYYYGEPDALQRDLDRFRNATPAGVRDWAARVLRAGARVIVRVLPEEPQPREGPREQRPPDLAVRGFTPPQPEQFTLSNGVAVHLWPRKDLPLVSVQVLAIPGAPLDEPARAGAAQFAAAMTQEGAGERDGPAFAQALQALGGSMSAGADYESLSVGVQALSRNLEPAAALLADAVIRPRFDAKDFERVKALVLDELHQSDDEPALVAPRVASRMLFADSDPFAWPTVGTVQTVSALTRAQVLDAYRAVVRPEVVKVLIAGDVAPEQAKAVLERQFGAWRGEAPPVPGRSDAQSGGRSGGDGAGVLRPAQGLRVFVVDRPGAVQTMIHLAAPAPRFASPSRVELELANIILGGSFTSRLNRNLREVHGYTYGARSRFAFRPALGTFRAFSAVRAEVTGPALKEFLGEVTRLAGGDIDAAELTKARETFRTAAAQSYGSLQGILAEGSEVLVSSAGWASPALDLAQASVAQPAGVNAAVKETLRLDRAVLVLVGDKALIAKQAAELGLPAPQELDASGQPAK